LAYNTDALVSRGRNIAEHYKEMKIDRYLLRIPGTWEGIQAVKKLEADGIHCHVTLVYSFTQAAAAAQAGASVIQANISRLKDWYTKHPGFLRDPKGPREDSGYSSDVHPGVQLVERIYNYCAQLHPKTKVMVSGIRRKQDALLLAGVDYLVVGPKVLEELNSQFTMSGYNDGLSANTTFDETDLEAQLTKERAQSVEFAPEETTEITKQLFQDGLGQAGLELLEDGIKGLVSDVKRLEPDFKKLAVGSF
jgi:transaldolase